MPFLPTLAVVIALSAASLLCPTSRPAPPGPRAPVGPAAGLTDFAPPAPSAHHIVRAPATLAFAALYPLESYPFDPYSLASAPALVAEASAPPAPRPSAGPRAATRLAAAGRPSCPGRRCVEPAPATPPRGPDPLAAARAEAEAAADALTVPLALPFAALAETLAPAARVVGRAAGLMRSGAASVEGSVAMLAECLP